MKKWLLAALLWLAALGAEAASGRCTFTGTVTEAGSGKGLAGVVVSDGLHCAVTDSRGHYTLVTERSEVRRLFVVTPSGYEIPFDANGAWSGFRPVDPARTKQRVDFRLTPGTEGGDFDLLIMGDPQQMSSRPHSSESWSYVTEALRTYGERAGHPLYQVFLGDMVTNEIEVPGRAEEYLQKLARTGIRSFHVPGNHDHVQSAEDYPASVAEYARIFGPYNFAVNIGAIHCIFLDTAAWKHSDKYKYDEGLNDEALCFLEEDLRYVPLDRPVMIFTHCPLTKRYGGDYPDALNADRFFALLEGRTVECWYGHIHFYSNYAYTPAELAAHAPGVKSLGSHIVGRCGGAWCCSGEVCRDGSPRGCIVLEVRGGEVSWRFHSFDARYADDCHCYLPHRFDGLGIADDAALYCNIYLWDNLWSTPEVWIGGQRAGVMEKVREAGMDSGKDPLYSYWFPIWERSGIVGFRNEPSKSYDNGHLFRFTPPEGCRACEIHYTDRWGRRYVRPLAW